MVFPVILKMHYDFLQEVAGFSEKGIDIFEKSVIIPLVPRV